MVGGVVRVGTADEVAWRQLRRTRIALAVAGGVLVVAALLPWARVSAPHGASFTVSSFGRGNDGWITLLAGVAVLALAALRAPRLSAPATGAAGLLALLVAMNNWTDMRRVIEHVENVQPAPVHGAIGIGLWLTVVAAVAVVTLSIAWMTMEFGLRRPVRRRRRASA
jgi:hypothetical protein